MSAGFLALIGYRGPYKESEGCERPRPLPLVDPRRELDGGRRQCVICNAPFVPKRRLAVTCKRACKRTHTERLNARLTGRS